MAVATINEAAYRKLLARTLPRVIETEAENERIIAELEKFDTLGRPLTPEERELTPQPREIQPSRCRRVCRRGHGDVLDLFVRGAGQLVNCRNGRTQLRVWARYTFQRS